MAWPLTCRDAARLLLEGEDRPLATTERLKLRLHLAMCQGCTRFGQQVQLMRGALDGWRRYAAEDDPAAPRDRRPDPDEG